MPSQSPTAQELQLLAHLRLTEAKALHATGLQAGAWYLAGYAVEVALKAVVCRALGVADYPEKAFRGSLKSHDLGELVLLSGLTRELEARSADAGFKEFWALVLSWQPQDRYQAVRSSEDVVDLLNALENQENGVFVWLSSRW